MVNSRDMVRSVVYNVLYGRSPMTTLVVKCFLKWSHYPFPPAEINDALESLYADGFVAHDGRHWYIPTYDDRFTLTTQGTQQ